ncbi:5e4888f6-28ff-4a7f-965d-a15ae8ed3c27 [Sclerotinia trifoliorum]|uniref:5e4888f6-28ff-4a7f-965d-a15ae8ed3c27 n=1 Tax=Sclerotinia trifoliorum TaxID=28548 RepID=A0A8H2VT08_9HELO|nr:5e4888f6-28ff-4a7f-965d-a15ae8ed3c27 [Sclerotinia trifoliorum]
METVNNTVNNIAAAASKVIWGEPQETTDAANATVVPETKGTEPISGEMGDTLKGEPYDKGNLDSTNTDPTTTNTSTSIKSTPTTTLSPPGQAAQTIDPSRASSTSDIVAKTLSDTHIAPLSSENPSTTSFKTSSEKPLISAEKPLISERINPNLPLRSENQSARVGGAETLGAQSGDVVSTAAGENKGLTPGSGVGVGDDKPSSTSNEQDVRTDLKPVSPDTKANVAAETQDKKEKHITTTGTAAEGGNFDATKPGAGIEADRLLGKDGKTEKMDAGVSGGTVGVLRLLMMRG